MDYICKKLFDHLTSDEYSDFVRNFIGYYYFKLNNGSDLIEYANTRKKKQPRIIAYKYLNNKKSASNRVVIAIPVDGYRNKTYSLGDEVFHILEKLELEQFSNDEIFFLLSISLKKGPNFKDMKEYKAEHYSLINDLDNVVLPYYSFIIGSGLDANFGVGDWDVLLDTLTCEVKSLTRVSETELIEFSKKMCNTNYYIPQFYKDMEVDNYFRAIYDHLYNSYYESLTDVHFNHLLQNYNLYQIANIISHQKHLDSQDIITFNYDIILEDILRNSFSLKSKSVYLGNSKTDQRVNIIHVHGCIPHELPIKSQYKKSVVLSHQEYLKAYRTRTSFTYKNLYKQLNKVNFIIGNSISDYEEQKVFYNHHRRYINKFSYAFMLRESEPILTAYKTYSLFRLGVIPLFFNDYHEMCDFLEGLTYDTIDIGE